MADRYEDFDAAVVEAGKPPVSFLIGGTEYELPPDLPAKVVLVQMRQLQDDGSVPQNVMYDWLEALVGDSNLEQMFEDGVTWKQMEALLTFLLGEYELTPEDAKDASADGDSPNS